MSIDGSDARTPWERLLPIDGKGGESAVAFSAFRLYSEMPADERSLRLAAEKLGKRLSLLERWSSKHRWKSRSEARDDHLARIEDQEAARLRRENAAKWANRREQQRDQDYEDAQATRRKMRQIIDSPLFKQTVQNDGKTINFQPAVWSINTGVNGLLKASALANQSIDRNGPVQDQVQEKLELEGIISPPKDKDTE
jgi:hypothetical protein